jgi:hypothetical protein
MNLDMIKNIDFSMAARCYGNFFCFNMYVLSCRLLHGSNMSWLKKLVFTLSEWAEFKPIYSNRLEKMMIMMKEKKNIGGS